MRLIVPPENPDLDGAASTYAYAEFLKNKEQRATGAVFGDLTEETEELLEDIDADIADAAYYIYSAEEITLVSASSMDNVTFRIPEEKIDEVIDHESIDPDHFSEAEFEIEEDAGSASTMIAWKFREEEMEISREAAKLLLAAIEDAGEPTEKDEEAVEWLEEQLG
ncbi:MAG: DHH family phosphoesterase [Candidatus Nanohaloarchaea archaeon]